jgi:hypothetical protein
MSFSNTYDTTNPGSAVSNREDLSDVLALLAPEQTPMLSMLPKIRASATFHEWTVDGLSSPSTAGVNEGSDVTSFADKFANRARLGNYVQTLRRDFMVSNLQQAVDSVGPAKYAQAELKAVKEIKRDVEATLMSTNDRQAENGADAYLMRGFGDWIDSGGPSDVPALYRTPSDSIYASNAFSEAILNQIITSIYRVSGQTQDLTLVADTALRRKISDFARISGANDYSVRRVNYNGGEGEIKLFVDLYKSDHGIVSIVNMNPDCAPDTTNKDTGYFINPEYAAVAELITLGSRSLPDFGGGQRGYVDWTGTLCVYHPGAHGKITQIA